MKKRWIALIALVSLGAGAGAASWFWTEFYAQFMNQALVTRTEAGIVSKEAVLLRLRAGKAEEALRLQETLLDGDLITAGVLARDGASFSANTRRAVQREAAARAASGHAPAKGDVGDAVAEAFRLVPAAAQAAR